MELLEIETEQTMTREEAAKFLHALADSLERHNQVAFERDGLKFKVRVPDEIEVEIELEIGDDESSIEVELTW